MSFTLLHGKIGHTSRNLSLLLVLTVLMIGYSCQSQAEVYKTKESSLKLNYKI